MPWEPTWRSDTWQTGRHVIGRKLQRKNKVAQDVGRKVQCSGNNAQKTERKKEKNSISLNYTELWANLECYMTTDPGMESLGRKMHSISLKN